MKIKTISTILLSLFSLSTLFAENEDKSYLADFADVKPTLSYKAQKEKEAIEYELVGIEYDNAIVNYVLGLKTNKKEQLIVNKNNKDIFLNYEPAMDYKKELNDLLLAGDKDAVVEKMRKDFYGLLTIIEANETVFVIQDSILEYLDLLVSTNRVEEFYAIFKTLRLKNLRQEYSDLSMILAKQLAQAGKYEKCLDVLGILNVEANNPEAIPELMEVLTILRDAKKIAQVNRYYQRLQVLEGNPLAVEAKMWSLYCDIQQGNVLTAKVLLENFKAMDKKSPEYSLYKLILGLIAKESKQDLSALENFSEGIVYGKSVNDWMPELMYNTALSYFKAKKTDVSRQILDELRKIYPNNVFAILAEKDLK